MAKHEFGIMQTPPQKGVRYDEYEPHKYNCISVDDEYIEEIDKKVLDMPAFWHTIDKEEKGLAYCGITLIPPTSVEYIMRLLPAEDELLEFMELLKTAQKENKFIIHYGLWKML